MRLARASRRDVFFDLGCGKGKLCVVAVREFGVRKAVGIELHRGRAAKAAEYVRELGLSDRIEIWNEDYMESDVGEATIAYCGHNETEEDVPHFERELGAGSRFVSLFLPFVGVVPTAVDYPFYLMKLPFRKTRDASRWTSHVLTKKATPDELFKELDRDREYRYDKRLLGRLMKERFLGREARPEGGQYNPSSPQIAYFESDSESRESHSRPVSMSAPVIWCPASCHFRVTSALPRRSISARASGWSLGTMMSREPASIRTRTSERSGTICIVNGTIGRKRIAPLSSAGRRSRRLAAMLAPFE